jgi:hypothetical protein
MPFDEPNSKHVITTFLQAKHWQLFLLTFGVPLIAQFIMMGTIMSGVFLDGNEQKNLSFQGIMSTMLIVYFAVGFVLFGWHWSVSIGLQKFVPEGVHMKTTKFKILFAYPMVYLLVFGLSILFVFTHTYDNETYISGPPMTFLDNVAIILPLHLFAMFCMLYVLYFTAKTIKTVELQRKVNFADFAGDFFLIWFNFVGFWIIQPKINKFVTEKGTTANTH